MASDGSGLDEASRMKNSFNKHRSGDVVFTLMPGWVETDNNGKVLSIDNNRHSYVPMVFFGDGIEPQTLSNIAVTDIAPTISSLLQTQFPNANIGTPIPLLTKPDESISPSRHDK
jgi:hypothetical protein